MAQTQPWSPSAATISKLDAEEATWLYKEEGVPKYTLPDVLAPGGTRVASAAEWEKTGRPATLDLFARHVYGRMPTQKLTTRSEAILTDAKLMDGAATHKRVRLTITGDGGKTFSFEFSLLTPNAARGPVACFVFINNRGTRSADPTRARKADFWPAEEIIARGYATAVFNNNTVDPDSAKPQDRARGVRAVFNPDGPADEAWATLAAWSWGASRVLDYLETDAAVDSRKVAVIGHSRGGKAALWAGATDQRFALTISNDSGRGGASLTRRRFGETLARITTQFAYWFAGRYKTYADRIDELPIDQHQLMALIAPRALYVASAGDDLWADPRGEFLSLAGAAPVYALHNLKTPAPTDMPPLSSPVVRDKTAYHIRPGKHGLTAYDWKCYMDFADKLWRPKQ